MDTKVSLPDDLVARADALAKREGTTRDAVYEAALADYLAARDPAEVTRALDDVVDEMGTYDEDTEWVRQASADALRRSEW